MSGSGFPPYPKVGSLLQGYIPVKGNQPLTQAKPSHPLLEIDHILDELEYMTIYNGITKQENEKEIRLAEKLNTTD